MKKNRTWMNPASGTGGINLILAFLFISLAANAEEGPYKWKATWTANAASDHVTGYMLHILPIGTDTTKKNLDYSGWLPKSSKSDGLDFSLFPSKWATEGFTVYDFATLPPGGKAAEAFYEYGRTLPVGNVTECAFTSESDSVCVFVTAYNTAGISAPSATVCAVQKDNEPPPDPELPGDFNGDGTVTLSDNILYWFILGMDSADPRWNARQIYLDPDTQNPSYCGILPEEMDLDGNSVITMGDKVKHEQWWGNTVKRK